MALVVEDGSGKSDSNSYSNTASADAYYADQGYAGVTSTDGSLIRGSRALDERYRSQLQGIKSTTGQAMAWPRDGVEDEDGNVLASDAIPARWVMASQEMARTLTASQTDDAPASVKRVKAGSAEVEFSAPKDLRTILSYVDELVSVYLKGGGNSFVRA